MFFFCIVYMWIRLGLGVIEFWVGGSRRVGMGGYC